MAHANHAHVELAEWLARLSSCARAYNRPDKETFRTLYLALRERVLVSLVNTNPPIRRISSLETPLIPELPII